MNRAAALADKIASRHFPDMCVPDGHTGVYVNSDTASGWNAEGYTPEAARGRFDRTVRMLSTATSSTPPRADIFLFVDGRLVEVESTTGAARHHRDVWRA